MRSQQRLSYIDYNTHEYQESEESFFIRLPKVLNIEEHASITQKEVLHHLSEALFCKRTLMSIILFVCITAIIMHVEQNSVVVESLSASKTAVSFFSIFLGFILVFRTQVCYDRWWEGRCLWGNLIFAAMNLAQQGQCWFKERENLRSLCCAIVCFSYACKGQLRGKSIQDDGRYLLQKGLVNMNQLTDVSKRNGWQESPCLYCFIMCAQSDMRSL